MMTSKIPSLLLNTASKKSIRHASKRLSSIWNFFGCKEDVKVEEKKTKPPPECCRRRRPAKPDPDLSIFGGQAYKTCGSAYVIQKDTVPPMEPSETEEDRILRKIETDHSVKHLVDDPMPEFKSVEQRLLDLTERRLHPFYKRYRSLPKPPRRQAVEEEKADGYECKSGEVVAEDMPKHLNLNKELLERKNIFADYKRIEIPKQMVVRILEIDRNRKRTLEKKESKVEKILGGKEKK